MKIGIIGLGVVGSAIKYGFEKIGHDVKVHDIKLETKIEDVLDTEICYICVPTCQNDDGSCDTSIVHDVIKTLMHKINYFGIIAVKSTVEPGTTMEYGNSVCFVPEFLRERCAITDFTENHDVLIVGTSDKSIYNKIVECHGRYPKKTIMLSKTESELVKYFNNIYNATQITFANSFYEVCKALNVNYSNVKDAIVQREHINDIYLDCNDNFRGFGGMCLPKDTAAINRLAKKLNVDVDFFEMLLKENNKYKTTVYEGMRK